MVLLVVCSFVVDLGMTWERRGDLQQQADQAALYAAEALPATDDASRLRAAKRAAFSIVCNIVSGQRTLDPDLPECPDSPTSSALDDYGQRLLDDGLVTFPSSTQVQVITPRSRVDFAFAGVTGAKETVQRKAATAQASSPGMILPIGLSLQCLAGAVNQAGLGSSVDGVLPISYVTPGNYSSTGPLGTDSEPVLGPWAPAFTGANASSSVAVGNPTKTGSTLTLRVTAPGLLPTLQGVTGGNQVVFMRGSTLVGPVAATSLNPATGALVVQIPPAVLSSPGVWYVKVKTFTATVLGIGLVGSNPKWSDNFVSFAVDPSADTVKDRLVSSLSDMLNLGDLVACGRLLDSPRVQDGGSPALTRNLQEGLDHTVTRNEALVQALGGQDLSVLDGGAEHLDTALQSVITNVVNNPAYGLAGCTNSTYNRLDNAATWAATQSAGAAPANCVRVKADAATEQEFTDGLLKGSPSSGTQPGYGRLSCARDGACDGSSTPTTLPGFSGTYNNDSFSDFVTGGPDGLLDSNLAYAMDTYLLPGVPAVTPSNSLQEGLYHSPRFGWVPVLTYLDLNAPGAADYPVLTFRPFFIDNGSAPNLHIAGLSPQRVVDRLGCHLSQRVENAIAAVAASLGVLASAVPTMVGALGLPSIQEHLCNGDVDAALADLGTALGTDMGREKAGLVLQGGHVKAARFMTIAPDALPPVTTDYDGPLTDYLGVGPKVVRLVR